MITNHSPSGGLPSGSSASKSLDGSHWNHVIIGAGPAGASAAIELARDGRKVLLVDAKRFPRRKACGGCFNRPAVRIVNSLLGPSHPVWRAARPLDQFRLFHRKRMLELPLPAGVYLDRARFDSMLVDKAIRCGAVFVDGVKAQLLPQTAGSEPSQTRTVLLDPSGTNDQVSAKSVVVASGLGSTLPKKMLGLRESSEKEQPEIYTRIGRHSRIGFSVDVQDSIAALPEGAIGMCVADEGYVGMTPSISGLHLAVAADKAAVRSHGQSDLVARILQQAGVGPLELPQSGWLATPPLTRRANQLAGDRVFLVGDAAGYVEPFTGEGIHWALHTGTALARVLTASGENWSAADAERWKRWYRHQICPDQRVCFVITRGLRYRPLRMMAEQLLRWRPQLAQPIVGRINQLTVET